LGCVKYNVINHMFFYVVLLCCQRVRWISTTRNIVHPPL